jgi:hypothetical protein
MTSNVVVMAMALIVCVGVFVLQYYLAKSDSKYLGYILPALAFVGALIFSVGYMRNPSDSVIELLASILAPLMLSIIPCIVLLSINSTVKKNKKIARDREAEQIDIDLRKDE